MENQNQFETAKFLKTGLRVYEALGEPARVFSLWRDLNRAFETVEQHYGQPLDCGTWHPAGDGWWTVAVEFSLEVA